MWTHVAFVIVLAYMYQASPMHKGPADTTKLECCNPLNWQEIDVGPYLPPPSKPKTVEPVDHPRDNNIEEKSFKGGKLFNTVIKTLSKTFTLGKSRSRSRNAPYSPQSVESRLPRAPEKPLGRVASMGPNLTFRSADDIVARSSDPSYVKGESDPRMLDLLVYKSTGELVPNTQMLVVQPHDYCKVCNPVQS